MKIVEATVAELVANHRMGRQADKETLELEEAMVFGLRDDYMPKRGRKATSTTA